MKHKLSAVILILFGATLLLAGCQNFLFAENVPFTWKDEYDSEQARQNRLHISNYESIGKGVIKDLSHDGKHLLLLNTSTVPPITYSAEILSPGDNENWLISFLTSEKKQQNMAFDDGSLGLFYVEENSGKAGATVNQLAWTSGDKSTTRTISAPGENVNSNFAVYEYDKVAYANDKNEVILANTSGERTVYSTGGLISIGKIYYSQSDNNLYFTAADPQDENIAGLYRAPLSETNELEPERIDKNIVDFSLNDTSGQLVYIKFHHNTRRLAYLDLDNGTRRGKVIGEGNFTSCRFTPDGEYIIYTRFSANNLRSNQSLWITDKDGKEPLQLTSPLYITSDIFFHPKEKTLYFSAGTQGGATTGDTGDQNISNVYQLSFTIE